MNRYLCAAVLFVFFGTNGIVSAEEKNSLHADTIKTSLKAEKNPQRRNHLYDDLATLKGSDAVSFLNETDSKTREAAALAIGRDKEYVDAPEKLKDLSKN